VWQPDARFLDRITWQLHFDPRAMAGAALLSDIDGGISDPMVDSPGPPPKPATYFEARDQLCRALREHARGHGGADDVRRAQNCVDDRLESEVIRPLLQPTGSPAKRNMQVALMEASRLFHGLGMAIVRADAGGPR
jgi:hypothetical protein